MGNLGRAGFGASNDGLVRRILSTLFFCKRLKIVSASGRTHTTPAMLALCLIKRIPGEQSPSLPQQVGLNVARTLLSYAQLLTPLSFEKLIDPPIVIPSWTKAISMHMPWRVPSRSYAAGWHICRTCCARNRCPRSHCFERRWRSIHVSSVRAIQCVSHFFPIQWAVY